jgi:L-aminopeptidase/D-esterase-like protein
MMKGGLGSASMVLPDGTMVGAIVVVNALGDIFDPQTQQVVAGARSTGNTQSPGVPAFPPGNPFGNTTIAAVATSAALTKEQTNKIAQMAHDGLAQAIRPAHTMFDGDVVFALALGPSSQTLHNSPLATAQVSAIGAAAAATLARAIVKAVHHATTLHGVPAIHP